MKKGLKVFGIAVGILGSTIFAYVNPFQPKHPENYVELTQKLMTQIDAELDTTQYLKKEYLEEIAMLASTFVPYQKSMESDQLYSPGRGHLLQECVKRNLPRETYDKLFKQTNFRNAYLENANLENAYLHGLRATSATFKNANLKGAVLTKTSLSKVNFMGAELAEAIFDNSILTKAQFQGADLKDARFYSTYLVDADFTDTRQSGVNFEAANTTGTIFESRLVQAD